MRINCLRPIDLLDQHLVAEYNETAMIIAALKRSLRTNKTLPKQDHYTLGKGHAIFFYDKGAYLKRRYEALKGELLVRGFNLNPARQLDWDVFEKHGLNNDWTPSYEDQLINVQCLLEKIQSKPNWYRYYKFPATDFCWINYYKNWEYAPF